MNIGIVIPGMRCDKADCTNKMGIASSFYSDEKLVGLLRGLGVSQYYQFCPEHLIEIMVDNEVWKSWELLT